MDGKQGGDPASSPTPREAPCVKDPPTPLRCRADAVQTFETKANTLLAQAQAHASCPLPSRTTTPEHRCCPATPAIYYALHPTR